MYPVYARIVNEPTWGKRVAGVFVDFFGDAFGEPVPEDEDEDDE
jgi:hypothetical protein